MYIRSSEPVQTDSTGSSLNPAFFWEDISIFDVYWVYKVTYELSHSSPSPSYRVSSQVHILPSLSPSISSFSWKGFHHTLSVRHLQFRIVSQVVVCLFGCIVCLSVTWCVSTFELHIHKKPSSYATSSYFFPSLISSTVWLSDTWCAFILKASPTSLCIISLEWLFFPWLSFKFFQVILL